MKLNERVAIITEENINRLSRLYGKINIYDLSRIVNNHLKIAIDEIEKDNIKDIEMANDKEVFTYPLNFCPNMKM